jgi:glycosyltransferase involved in cell wall biosynthesis
VSGSVSEQGKRTVVVLNHFAQPRSSPGGTRHVELFSRLEGWTARVIAADRNLLTGEPVHGDGVLETVRVTRQSGRPVARIVNWASYAVAAFARAVRARPLDAVVGSSPHMLAAVTGLVVARSRRVPFVLEVRDLWPQVLVEMDAVGERSVVYRALEGLERFLYRHADAVVVLAEGSSEHIQQRGLPAERIYFVPNGADVNDFTASGDRSGLRRQLGLDGVVAVYAGAHGRANGLDLLLDAALRLSACATPVTVLLIGDGPEKTRLMKRAGDERIAQVRFLDPVPKSEVPNVLAACDIGVHCLADIQLFARAVSPNKLFDYMAAGLPVLTNTPGEVAAFVEASDGGLCVGPRGLADGLEKLAGLTHEQRRRLGESGREHVLATRSRSVMARRMEAVLDDVVARRGSRA